MRGIEEIPLLYDAMMAVAEASGFASWRRALVAGARGLNRDTERSVMAAGFEIEAEGRRALRNVRLFSARAWVSAHGLPAPCTGVGDPGSPGWLLALRPAGRDPER